MPRSQERGPTKFALITSFATSQSTVSQAMFDTQGSVQRALDAVGERGAEDGRAMKVVVKRYQCRLPWWRKRDRVHVPVWQDILQANTQATQSCQGALPAPPFAQGPPALDNSHTPVADGGRGRPILEPDCTTVRAGAARDCERPFVTSVRLALARCGRCAKLLFLAVSG